MTPLIHSTAGMPEKNGILSLRAAVTAFSSRADSEGEKLAVAAAYVLSPSLGSRREEDDVGRGRKILSTSQLQTALLTRLGMVGFDVYTVDNSFSK